MECQERLYFDALSLAGLKPSWGIALTDTTSQGLI